MTKQELFDWASRTAPTLDEDYVNAIIVEYIEETGDVDSANEAFEIYETSLSETV